MRSGSANRNKIWFQVEMKSGSHSTSTINLIYLISASNSIATHSHVTNCTMVPVLKADWTITKTKHQEEKNWTQLKKHIDEY